MPQVKIRLSPVIGHEHLAVFVRRHRARINVQVGVKLDDGYVDAPVLEHPTDRCTGDAFAKGAGDSARDEDVSPGGAHGTRSVMQL